MNAAEIIKLACQGNAEAERFCHSWWAFAHLVDDLADRDRAVSRELLASVFVSYTLELCGNPFFLTHRAQLLGLMVQAANAWVDSGQLIKSQAERDVLKGFYHEVIYHCAFIVGGWNHLRQVTGQAREYDFEQNTLKMTHYQEAGGS